MHQINAVWKFVFLVVGFDSTCQNPAIMMRQHSKAALAANSFLDYDPNVCIC